MTLDARSRTRDRANAAAAWVRLLAVVSGRGVVAMLLGLAIWAAGPTLLGWHVTTVVSDSMQPAIATGDVVAARPTAADDLAVGQVLLATDPDHADRLRLHRYDAVADDGGIVTRGDANPHPDSSPIVADDVLGVAVLRVPLVGQPVVWVQHQQWAPLLATVGIIVAALALAVQSAIGRTRETEREAVDVDGQEPADADGQETANLDGATAGVDEHSRPRAHSRHGLAVVVALVTAALVAAIATPVAVAHAAFSDTAGQHATFSAATATVPTQVRCVGNANGTATISWQHAGGGAGFTPIVGGHAGAALGPDATISAQSLFSWSRQAVAVRSDLGGSWSATSSTVTISVFSIFGIGSVRCA